MALAGVAARRKCEAHVLAGEVAVNGETARDLGRQVEPGRDQITFRGKPLKFQQHVYFLLHKPSGYTTTASDPHAEKTVYELLPPELKRGQVEDLSPKMPGRPDPFRVFPVGRLDRESTGLLLFTNDGELANRLTHPRYEVAKRYEAQMDRPLAPAALERLRRGVRLEDGLARPEEADLLPGGAVRLLLREGKKREVRRIFQELGYRVVALRRTGFGPLALGDLPAGQGRFLTEQELRRLRETSP